MFGGNRLPGRGRAGVGPVPIPREEKVQLRPLPRNSMDENQQCAVATTPPSMSSKPLEERAVEAAVTTLANCTLDTPQGKAASANEIDGDDTTSVTAQDLASETTELTRNTNNVPNDPESTRFFPEIELVAQFGQPLEYACGEALRKHVLEPVLAEYNTMDEDVLTEAPRLLSLISKGHLLFMKNGDKVGCGSIERICNTDGGSLVMWYDAGDKYLSYVDEVWAEWWVRRCHVFDPMCEMLKLCDLDGKKLGVAYIERNIVDRNLFGDERRGRVTLIRGIRLVPRINKEVKIRRDLVDDVPQQELEYHGIATLLVCHVIFLSIRYGAEAIAVHPPKSERAEKFYESLMGPPLLVEDDDGRRYYRLEGADKWKILQNCFRYQLNLFTALREEEVVRTEQEEKAAIVAEVMEVERLKKEASDAAKSELAGRRQAEDDARIEKEEAEAANMEKSRETKTFNNDSTNARGVISDGEQSDTNPGDQGDEQSEGSHSAEELSEERSTKTNGEVTVSTKRPVELEHAALDGDLGGTKKPKLSDS